MPATQYQRNALLVLASAIIFLSFLIIRPMITPILAGLILAYLFYPLYLFFYKAFQRFEPKARLARLTTILCIILIFLAPLISLLLLIVWKLPLIATGLTSLVDDLSDYLIGLQVIIKQNTILQMLPVDINPRETLHTVSLAIFKFLQGLAADMPQVILGSFIALFIVYYIFKSANRIVEVIINLIPLKKQQQQLIINRFNGLGRGMVASQFVIAAVQAVLMIVACLILRLPHPFLFGLVTFVLAVIPFLGAIVLWASLTLYLALQVQHGLVPAWQPWFMGIYGFILVSMVDNFIRPKMLATAAELNPALVLVGFIGGFLLFGLPGIFLGPLILGLVELAVEVYKEVA